MGKSEMKNLTDQDYATLGKLLNDFGLDKISFDAFWKEMHHNRFTQEDIEAWCARYDREKET